MASAILAWVEPRKWAVIDRRAWAQLERRGLLGTRPAVFNQGHWGEYLELVRRIAKAAGRTPQLIDYWLYSEDGGRGFSARCWRRRP